MADGIALEERGVPTAVVITEAFCGIADTMARDLGVPGYPYVVIPHPISSLTPEELRARAEQALPEVVRLLSVAERRVDRLPAEVWGNPVEEDPLLKGELSLVESCYARGWTDGFPVVPPTENLVRAFLARVDRDPEEVILAQEHLGRRCTVRLAAANAVMAGCRPESFPVVLAALEALQLLVGDRAVLMPQHGQAVLVIVNGPIRDQLAFNCRDNVLGPGDRTNATVGRAVRLVILNALGIRPHGYDQSTQGTPAKFSFCIAENEEESPWEPLHVERGFGREESAVTVALAQSTLHVEQRDSKQPEHILLSIADSMSYAGAYFPWRFGHGSIVVMGPEHAQLLAQAGWSKRQVREFLWEHFGRRAGELRRLGKGGGLDPQLPEEAFVRFAPAPEAITLVVAGARNAGVSTVCPTFAWQTITRRIPQARAHE
ncbi:MAG: hypothetical protein QN172_05360 [Armatimonadota bacterium]|nr:hypothetical protein [Armatimonadota bacterium]MDR7562951.1 hypothetical protein [Armatimonadota bacterium]MDR7601869.1 hypothetical protein [Armatimonadota bacterium]